MATAATAEGGGRGAKKALGAGGRSFGKEPAARKPFLGRDLGKPSKKASETGARRLTPGRASLLFRLPIERRPAKARPRTTGDAPPPGCSSFAESACPRRPHRTAPPPGLGRGWGNRPHGRQLFENKGGPRKTKRALACSVASRMLSRRPGCVPSLPYPGVTASKQTPKSKTNF